MEDISVNNTDNRGRQNMLRQMDTWRGVLALRDTDLISKTPPLLLGRLDICSLGVGIAFIARLRGGTPHSPLSHTHCDLRERWRE